MPAVVQVWSDELQSPQDPFGEIRGFPFPPPHVCAELRSKHEKLDSFLKEVCKNIKKDLSSH